MARMLALFGALALAVSGMLVSVQGVPARPRDAVIPGQYIVTVKPGVNPAAKAKALAQAEGLGVLQVYEHALRGFAATVPPARLKRLQADPDIATIVADQEVWASGQTIPTGIDRIDGELSSARSGNGSGAVDVDVAVIDTGSGPHPDLTIAGGRNCQPGRSYADGNGHGTHVAGTIGARDDANGVVGVAPGARIWSVRVLDNRGSGSWSAVICGIDWVRANAATIEVANMSLGGAGSEGSCTDGGLRQAICSTVAAGVTFVVAAGNDARDAATFAPATYPEVIAVSALADFNGAPGGGAAATCRADQDDTLADFSNFGADVDIAAPGVCILSTWLNGGYATISGTSMASPHVAGAAALYKAANPKASPEQVRAALVALQQPGPIAGDPDGSAEGVLRVSGL